MVAGHCTGVNTTQFTSIKITVGVPFQSNSLLVNLQPCDCFMILFPQFKICNCDT